MFARRENLAARGLPFRSVNGSVKEHDREICANVQGDVIRSPASSVPAEEMLVTSPACPAAALQCSGAH